LCGELGGEAKFVTDDYLAFVVAVRLGTTAWMLPDLVTNLAADGDLPLGTARSILEAIRQRYHRGVVEHSLVRLQEVIPDAKGISAGQ